MGATLNSIINKRVKLTVPLDPKNPDAGTVNVVYRPKALTQKKATAFFEAVEKAKDRGMKATIERFIDLIEEWDLRWDETDSEPIPLTVEALGDVPMTVLNGIFDAVSNDQRPDPTTESD